MVKSPIRILAVDGGGVVENTLPGFSNDFTQAIPVSSAKRTSWRGRRRAD